MNLNKIKGNTYFIDAPTNIGVYVFKNKNCLLVDTSINNTGARKIDEILNKNGLHPKFIINTHSHIDHCGGNQYFKTKYTGSIIYSSKYEKLFIENPDLFPSILFSSTPIKGIEKSANPPEVDFIIEYGINKINDEKFEIISLKGHSSEQIGIITPEKVCFLGDAVFSEEIMEKYSLPYLFNIQASIETLNSLNSVEADFFVLSHGKNVLSKDELSVLVEKNIENINNYKYQVLELLDEPMTKEDILENLAILNNLEMEFRQYHLNFSAVSAFIKYLHDSNLIDYSIENGKLYYFKMAAI